MVIQPEHKEFDLPPLGYRDDPRGGAVAWALLALGISLVVGTLLAMIWSMIP
jgi:hypothetical protein